MQEFECSNKSEGYYSDNRFCDIFHYCKVSLQPNLNSSYKMRIFTHFYNQFSNSTKKVDNSQYTFICPDDSLFNKTLLICEQNHHLAQRDFVDCRSNEDDRKRFYRNSDLLFRRKEKIFAANPKGRSDRNQDDVPIVDGEDDQSLVKLDDNQQPLDTEEILRMIQSNINSQNYENENYDGLFKSKTTDKNKIVSSASLASSSFANRLQSQKLPDSKQNQSDLKTVHDLSDFNVFTSTSLNPTSYFIEPTAVPDKNLYVDAFMVSTSKMTTTAEVLSAASMPSVDSPMFDAIINHSRTSNGTFIDQIASSTTPSSTIHQAITQSDFPEIGKISNESLLNGSFPSNISKTISFDTDDFKGDNISLILKNKSLIRSSQSQPFRTWLIENSLRSNQTDYRHSMSGISKDRNNIRRKSKKKKIHNYRKNDSNYYLNHNLNDLWTKKDQKEKNAKKFDQILKMTIQSYPLIEDTKSKRLSSSDMIPLAQLFGPNSSSTDFSETFLSGKKAYRETAIDNKDKNDINNSKSDGKNNYNKIMDFDQQNQDRNHYQMNTNSNNLKTSSFIHRIIPENFSIFYLKTVPRFLKNLRFNIVNLSDTDRSKKNFVDDNDSGIGAIDDNENDYIGVESNKFPTILPSYFPQDESYDPVSKTNEHDVEGLDVMTNDPNQEKTDDFKDDEGFVNGVSDEKMNLKGDENEFDLAMSTSNLIEHRDRKSFLTPANLFDGSLYFQDTPFDDNDWWAKTIKHDNRDSKFIPNQLDHFNSLSNYRKEQRKQHEKNLKRSKIDLMMLMLDSTLSHNNGDRNQFKTDFDDFNFDDENFSILSIPVLVPSNLTQQDYRARMSASLLRPVVIPLKEKDRLVPVYLLQFSDHQPFKKNRQQKRYNHYRFKRSANEIINEAIFLNKDDRLENLQHDHHPAGVIMDGNPEIHVKSGGASKTIGNNGKKLLQFPIKSKLFSSILPSILKNKLIKSTKWKSHDHPTKKSKGSSSMMTIPLYLSHDAYLAYLQSLFKEDPSNPLNQFNPHSIYDLKDFNNNDQFLSPFYFTADPSHYYVTNNQHPYLKHSKYLKNRNHTDKTIDYGSVGDNGLLTMNSMVDSKSASINSITLPPVAPVPIPYATKYSFHDEVMYGKSEQNAKEAASTASSSLLASSTPSSINNVRNKVSTVPSNANVYVPDELFEDFQVFKPIDTSVDSMKPSSLHTPKPENLEAESNEAFNLISTYSGINKALNRYNSREKNDDKEEEKQEISTTQSSNFNPVIDHRSISTPASTSPNPRLNNYRHQNDIKNMVIINYANGTSLKITGKKINEINNGHSGGHVVIGSNSSKSRPGSISSDRMMSSASTVTATMMVAPPSIRIGATTTSTKSPKLIYESEINHEPVFNGLVLNEARNNLQKTSPSKNIYG